MKTSGVRPMCGKDLDEAHSYPDSKNVVQKEVLTMLPRCCLKAETHILFEADTDVIYAVCSKCKCKNRSFYIENLNTKDEWNPVNGWDSSHLNREIKKQGMLSVLISSQCCKGRGFFLCHAFGISKILGVCAGCGKSSVPFLIENESEC